MNVPQDIVAVCNMDLLSDDLLHKILGFVGENSYLVTAKINKRWKQIFETYNIIKQTSIYGYAPLSVIESYERSNSRQMSSRCRDNIELGVLQKKARDQKVKGIVYYNRFDMIRSLLVPVNGIVSMPNVDFLRYVCYEAAFRGKQVIISEVINNLDPRFMFTIKHDGRICAGAAMGRQYNLVKWLQANGFSLSDYMCPVYPAEQNNLEMLKWMYDQGCKLNIFTFSKAVKHGNVEMVQWLLSVNCPVDIEEVFPCAASGGNIDMLEWLREKKEFPWGNGPFSSAACNGHVDVLEWLLSKGCPHEKDAIESARINGQDEAFVWLRENGFPDEPSDSEESYFDY